MAIVGNKNAKCKINLPTQTIVTAIFVRTQKRKMSSIKQPHGQFV